MNISITLETLIESIEVLSLANQALLFEQLYRRRIDKQRQENTKKTAETIEALFPADNTLTTSNSDQPENPLLMVPATLKNNPLFDEVLGYIEAYRRELDGVTESKILLLGSYASLGTKAIHL